jgi:hypothetical protein
MAVYDLVDALTPGTADCELLMSLAGDPAQDDLADKLVDILGLPLAEAATFATRRARTMGAPRLRQGVQLLTRLLADEGVTLDEEQVLALQVLPS